MKRTTVLSALASAAALLLAACHHAPNAGPQGMPAPVVTVAPPMQKTVSEWDEFTARVDAVESVEIRPRITGHLTEVRFQSGQLVKKGDVLFVIDPRWHQAEFQRTEANVEQARSKAEIAEREAKRGEDLAKTKAISAEEADTRRSNAAAARGALLAAEAARDSAKLDLDFTQVRSPIDGRVSRPVLTTGNYVSGVAGFTTLLTTVVSVDSVYLYASVDEARFLKYQRLVREKKLTDASTGKVPAEVQLNGETGWPHSGFIESFDNRLDATTGSIVVRALFPNPDGVLVPGLFARVRIPASAPYAALLVDEKVIGTDQSERFVMTVGAGNMAEYKKVTLGPMFEGLRVIATGLAATDRVITTGLQMVRPGAPVSPQPAADAAAKTAAR
jgi:RND family efflux transporter MFP subunit